MPKLPLLASYGLVWRKPEVKQPDAHWEGFKQPSGIHLAQRSARAPARGGQEGVSGSHQLRGMDSQQVAGFHHSVQKWVLQHLQQQDETLLNLQAQKKGHSFWSVVSPCPRPLPKALRQPDRAAAASPGTTSEAEEGLQEPFRALRWLGGHSWLCSRSQACCSSRQECLLLGALSRQDSVLQGQLEARVPL